MENVKNAVCCFSIEECVFERDDMTYLHNDVRIGEQKLKLTSICLCNSSSENSMRKS
jgi:hypothetical protein